VILSPRVSRLGNSNPRRPAGNDNDIIWAFVLNGNPQKISEGGRVEPDEFLSARRDLMPRKKYMWASVQTVRGCAKHCSFCSVSRTDRELSAAVRSLNAVTQRNRHLHTHSYLSLPQTKLSAASVLPVPL
jgi:hypothetical protein